MVTALCVMLVLGIARLLVDLADVWTPTIDGAVEVAVAVGPAPAVGRVVLDRGVPRLEIEGEPHGRVLVTAEGLQSITIQLDGLGRAVVAPFEIPAGISEIRLRGVGSEQTSIPLPALPTATPTRTQSPTRSATPTATATFTAIVTSNPTCSATDTPTPPPPTATGLTLMGPTATAAALKPTAVPNPPTGLSPRQAPPVLHLVPDAGRRLALTFDGAKSAGGTADLLDLLQRLDLKITIFVTGEFIERYPGIVRTALLAGHEVGNHTYSHPHLTSYSKNRRHDLLSNVSRTWFESELRRTEQAFRDATGRSMAPLWRAPYGEENATLRGWAMDLGYLHIRWSSLRGVSLDSLDWVEDEHSSLYFDSSRLVDRLLAFPELKGGIVLMHLSTKRRVPPWSDLPRFTAEIRSRGLQVDSVSNLLERSDRWRPWLERARNRHSEVFPE